MLRLPGLASKFGFFTAGAGRAYGFAPIRGIRLSADAGARFRVEANFDGLEGIGNGSFSSSPSGIVGVDDGAEARIG